METELKLIQASSLLHFELRIMWLLTAGYASVFVLFLVHLFTEDDKPADYAVSILKILLLLHAGVIIMRTVVGARPPFQTLYECLSWFALSNQLALVLVIRRYKYRLAGILVTGVGVAAMLYALIGRDPAIKPMFPQLNHWLYVPHVVLAFTSYSMFVVSAAIEASYLVARSRLKGKAERAWGIVAEDLEGFRDLARVLVLVGFPMLTFGIASGAAWADDAWGNYWSWDPKETWSLITWTAYAVYLHSLSVPSMRRNVSIFFNFLGFVCMIMTFVGVNWLVKLLGIFSIHAYAV